MALYQHDYAIIESLLNYTATPENYIDAGLTLAFVEDPWNQDAVGAVFQDSTRQMYVDLLRHWEKYGEAMSKELFLSSYPTFRERGYDDSPEVILDMIEPLINEGRKNALLRELTVAIQTGNYEDYREIMARGVGAFEGADPNRIHEYKVAAEVEKIRIRKEAEQHYALEQNEDDDVFGTNMMAEPEDTDYLVRDLFPEGGYLMITAQKKRGKTTILGNLISSLVDAGHFLDEFKVTGYNRVFLLDTEMPENQHKHWLKSWGTFNHSRLFVGHYNGRAGVVARMLFDPQRRANFIKHLQDNAIDVLVIDPLGPILRACGMDENSADVGRVVDAIKGIVQEAGVRSLIIVHHQGKDAAKGARGHSVLVDTPDVVWELDGKGDIGSDRLRAWGRDVNKSVGLYFDSETKRYSAFYDEDETMPSDDAVILAIIRDNPGLSGNRIYAMTSGMNKTNCTEIIRGLKDAGKIINIGSETMPKWEAA